MNLVPVIDLQKGIAVHADGGERSQYRAVQGVCGTGHDPIKLASSMLEKANSEEIYVADLDGIVERQPNWGLIRSFETIAGRVWLDLGIRDRTDLQTFSSGCRCSLIVGLETVTGPDVLAAAIELFGTENVLFSIDMRQGRLLGNVDGWLLPPQSSAVDIARQAMAVGCQNLLLLDLGTVGKASGPYSLSCHERLKSEWPEVRLFHGGGVRNRADVKRLADGGVDAVLVATALHNGSLP